MPQQSMVAAKGRKEKRFMVHTPVWFGFKAVMKSDLTNVKETGTLFATKAVLIIRCGKKSDSAGLLFGLSRLLHHFRRGCKEKLEKFIRAIAPRNLSAWGVGQSRDARAVETRAEISPTAPALARLRFPRAFA